MINLVYQIIIMLLGFYSISFFKNDLRSSDAKVLRWLWVYHLFFGFIFAHFFVGDANFYWEVASNMDFQEFVDGLTTKFGTFFIFSFNYFPASVLKMSYLSGTLLHAYFGFLGLCCIYCLLVKLIPKNSYIGKIKIFPLLMFLPNLHFWTVSVGKDSTSFLFIALIFYSLLHFKKKFVLGFFGLLMLYLVRPHVALFVLAGIGIAFFLNQKTSTFKRVFISLIFIGVAIIILPKVLEYSNIDSLTTSEVSNFVSNRTGNLSREHTDSRIDLSSYPFVLKVFTFLFRPLFFDITNITAIIASFENLFLLLITLKALANNPIKSYKAAPLIIQSSIIFLLIGTLAFSQTLSNLGIMLRMRNMFLPALFMFVLWSNSYNNKTKRI